MACNLALVEQQKSKILKNRRIFVFRIMLLPFTFIFSAFREAAVKRAALLFFEAKKKLSPCIEG